MNLCHISQLVARVVCFFFFFNDTATTEIYTLSLHDALRSRWCLWTELNGQRRRGGRWWRNDADRKSTRLNSSHVRISYAVFCLKKKKLVLGTEPSASSATLSSHCSSNPDSSSTTPSTSPAA